MPVTEVVVSSTRVSHEYLHADGISYVHDMGPVRAIVILTRLERYAWFKG